MGRFTRLNAACELGHIVEIGGGDAYLCGGQSLRLALLANDDFLELVEVRADAIGNLVQIDSTLGGGHLGPFLLGNVGSVDGFVHVFNGAGGLTARHFLGRGVQHFNPLS